MGNMIVEGMSIEEAFKQLHEDETDSGQLTLFDLDDSSTRPYNLYTAIKHYFGERRKHISNPPGQGLHTSMDDIINQIVSHHPGTRAEDEVSGVTRKEHAEIHETVFRRLQDDLIDALKTSELTYDQIARIVQGIAYSENAEMYRQKEQDIVDAKLISYIRYVNNALKTLKNKYIKYVREATKDVLNKRNSKQIAFDFDTLD